MNRMGACTFHFHSEVREREVKYSFNIKISVWALVRCSQWNYNCYLIVAALSFKNYKIFGSFLNFLSPTMLSMAKKGGNKELK